MTTIPNLAGERPLTNFTRRYFWVNRWLKATGNKPTTVRHTWVRCSTCNSAMQIPATLAAECGRFECHRHHQGGI